MPAEPAAKVGGAVILAGGFGRRFGSDKRLHELRPGRPMLLETLACYAAVYQQRLVVVREDDDVLVELIERESADTIVVRCDQSCLGMGHTLACGIREACGWPWACIALADMPFVLIDTLRQLEKTFRQTTPPAIVQPSYQDQPGHPVIFDAAFFSELETLTGDEGARSVLEHHRDRVRRISVQDVGVIRDLDQPQETNDD